MPRCYMVKKGAPRNNTEPLPSSSTEMSVAPPDQQQVNTELPQDAAAEYVELRNAPVYERSAADTEAAHELLSLAAGVRPLPPATILTTPLLNEPLPQAPLLTAPLLTTPLVTTPLLTTPLLTAPLLLHPPPIIPVYTYTLQPTAVYIVADEPPEPMYHAVQVPMQQNYTMPTLQPEQPLHWSVNYSAQPTGAYLSTTNGQLLPLFNVVYPMQWIDYSMENPPSHMNYITYPNVLPPPPPQEHQPPNNVSVIERKPESGTLTTLTIEEVTTDSEPGPLVIDFPTVEPALGQDMQEQPMQSDQLVQPAQPTPAAAPKLDSDDKACVVAVKVKQNKYDCNQCGKCYATSSNLSRHKQTHRRLDSDSARKCTECGKVYVSMPAMSMHMLTHSMGHVCGVCGKQFSRPWLLRGHVRSHTGEKPYPCVTCGKAFADRSNLRAHLQTHSSDKKYECARCKKSFALKSYLNKHQEVACTRSDDETAA